MGATVRRLADATPLRRGIAAAVGALLLLASIAPCSTGSAQAAEFFTLKGHGGPIMHIAVSPFSGRIATASFDNSVGLWRDRTPVWLEGHAAAVNVVGFVDADRLASAGDDFSVIIWNRADGSHRTLTGHRGKVVALAVAPDRATIASASWDGSIGLWPLDGGEAVFLSGPSSGVNALAYAQDGKTLYAGYVDGSIRVWDLAERAVRRVLVRGGFGVNEIVLGGRDADGRPGWLAYGAVDGVTRVVEPDTGRAIRNLTVDRGPILALALDPSGRWLARGDGHGYITLFDTRDWHIERDFHAALRGPIWALAFSADGTSILAGGIENIVYAWPIDLLSEFGPMADSAPAFLRNPAEMGNGERQFARKCSICHALTDDRSRKAGPSLHGIFGRRAGSLPGYEYSATLEGSDLIWDASTIDRLFDLGPDHFIPGSKMPMQRITKADDRRDLIEFLDKATR
ncbi:MAG: c-type cytochrome [Burkholderiaceae bacterium]